MYQYCKWSLVARLYATGCRAVTECSLLIEARFLPWPFLYQRKDADLSKEHMSLASIFSTHRESLSNHVIRQILGKTNIYERGWISSRCAWFNRGQDQYHNNGMISTSDERKLGLRKLSIIIVSLINTMFSCHVLTLNLVRPRSTCLPCILCAFAAYEGSRAMGRR